MSDETNGFTITLKGGKDFADPWVVVRGGTKEELIANLCATADIDAASVASLDLSLNQLAVLAASDFQRQWALRNQLGAAVIDGNTDGVKDAEPPQEVTVIETKASAAKVKATDPLPQDKATAEAEPGPEVEKQSDVPKEIADALEAAQDGTALGKIWQAHRAAYEASPAIQQAFKARQAAIKAAG